MSEQENNKMEAWLKAYRQQRLDLWNEAPVELDEPTRTMLMAEVRRQKTASPAEATPASEPTFGWLRWALGGMTAAIVALGISSISNFNQSNGPDNLAKATLDSSEAEGGTQTGTADASVDQLNRDEAKNHRAEMSGGLGGGMGGIAPKGSVAGSPGAVGTVQAVPSQPSQTAPIHPAPRPVMVRNNPSRQNVKMANGNYYNNSREMQLNFAQQSRARSARSGVAFSRMAKQKELPKPVLVNFELKRVGNTIRVVDGDGSVYTGTVINEEAMSEAEERQALAEHGEVAGGEVAGGGSAGPAGFAPGKPVDVAKKMRRGSQAFFRVQGTNKTLKQLVILEATLDNSVFSKEKADKPANAFMATRREPLLYKPAERAPKNLNRNLGAIRAIARLRVLGNARIGKENYPVDAYLDIKAAGKNKAPSNTPADVKKK